MRTIRGTSSDRRTRFYSIAKELKRLRRVEPAAFRQYAERVRLAPPPPRKGRPQEVPIAPLEAAALALIERRKLWSACDVLLGACRLTIRTERPDRRVFDLLIGLTTRYPTLARYRAQALALVKPPGGALPFPGSPRARLASRMQIWDGDNWKRRWQRPGPLHWGHPFETVERVTRRWFFFGERSITRRARLVLLPGGHPRPVLLPRGA